MENREPEEKKEELEENPYLDEKPGSWVAVVGVGLAWLIYFMLPVRPAGYVNGTVTIAILSLVGYGIVYAIAKAFMNKK